MECRLVKDRVKSEALHAWTKFKLESVASKYSFSSRTKLVDHFNKHVIIEDEFRSVYRNVNEYLEGARDVVRHGHKVSYRYIDIDRNIDEVRWLYEIYGKHYEKWSC